jgi:hypothetical protein
MPTLYQKVFGKNGILAYGKASGTVDHLFTWAGDSGPDGFDSLAALVDAWNHAPKPAGKPSQKAMLFCQSFDARSLPTDLDQFTRPSGGIELCWGTCAYWADAVFAPSPPKIVIPDPSGSSAIVVTGDTGILLESDTVPTSLDDFTASADASNLALLLGGSTSTSWSVDDVVATGGLAIDLSPVKGFVAGAVGIGIDWAKAPSDPHPVKRVAYSYIAPPANKPGEEPVRAKIWSSQFAELVDASSGAGASCRAYFDPRDNSTDSPWVIGVGPQKEFNSRLLFGTAVVHTSLYAADGSRFLLTAKNDDSAAARLGFVFDMIDANGKMTSRGGATFHPEGLFAIARSPSVSEAAPVAASFASDLVAGSAPTEFFDVSGASHIEFVKGPAFFVADSQGATFPPKLLDDRDGLVRTAHLRFSNAGAASETPFHSQPSEAALFEDGGQSLGYLRRRRRPIGNAQVPLPVFPFPGYAPTGDATYREIVDLDTTHLASYRRSHTSKPAALAAVAPKDAGGPPELAVTPQGLLAELAPDGSYAALYLGNPDSLNERDEFCITIANPANALYEQVQHALTSNQLFMVFKDTPADVLKVISPSVAIYARDFAFSVGPDELAAPTTKLRASVMLVKFFSGRSLDDLVKVPQAWALPQALAPSGNAGIKDLTGLGPAPSASTKPELKHLESIWFDAAWQGILLLDLPIDVMPNALESLRPGIAAGKKLRTHHFGLNAVAAKKTDLSTPRPRRLGSAFGLIDYELQPADHVSPPATADAEPGSTGNGGRSYSFVVQSLQIAFENSQISSLGAQLNVTFSHLFWDKLSGPDGADPTVKLYGSYDRRVTPDGKQQDVFSFVTRDPLVAKFSDSMLSTITFSKAQLSVTAAERDASDKLVSLTALVSIDATLKFNESIEKFPLFSVKEIRVSSFGFKFDYQPKPDPAPATFDFGFFANGISAEINFTADALQSLLSFLPVKMKGMAVAIDQLIDLSDLHFQPLQLDANFGSKLQFGFLMELDFGALGQLSGAASGLRVPFLLGWAGKKLVCGIQFPGVDGKFDVGIQQFIRLQADALNLVRCNDAQTGQLTAIGIQAVNARVVMLGHRLPEGDLAVAIFIPLSSGRKPSWAFGLKNGPWYVGGGHRVDIAGSGGDTFQGVIDSYQAALQGIDKNKSICDLIKSVPTNPGSEDWAVAAEYSGDFVVGVLVADPKLYGIRVKLPVVGDIDILYRRVDGQLGIFSLQYILPGLVRTIEVGVASIRLPGFRVEVETNGGWLLDVGYPRNNDYSVSCQVEVGIFVGAGGFYYGKTSALSADLLHFDGGYGYLPPDPSQLVQFDALRFGFAARVGIGRSFTIGILSGDASLTLFGGLEGVAGYLKRESVADPKLFALRGFFGLMLDVQCSVDFPLIRATARILAYAEVGLEIRRVLAKDSSGVHQLLTLPLTIFAEIGITVTATVRIHVGCVSVSISLSFSAVWHYEETIGGLSHTPFQLPAPQTARIAAIGPAASAPPWSTVYRYWSAPRELDVYVTVLPCLAATDDVQLPPGSCKECAVGTMLLSALETDASASALGDLTRFLLGWVLIPPDKASGNPNDYDAIDVNLDTVAALIVQMKPDGPFWNGFAAALLTVVPAQFAPTWKLLSPNQDEPFAVIPPWPGSSFTNKTSGAAAPVALATTVTKDSMAIRSGDCAFVDYCQHALISTLSEVNLMLRDIDPSQPRSRKWSEIWSSMRATLQ